MEVADKYTVYYEHVPGRVRESKKIKIFRDFSIQTDHQLEHNRPDLVVVYKQQAVCQIIDIGAPVDARVELKKGKLINIKKVWKVKTRVVPIDIGALGTIPY